MNPVFHDEAGSDLGEDFVAQEWQEVDPKFFFQEVHVLRAALPGCDDLIFFQKSLGGLSECLADMEHTSASFTSKFRIPVFGEILCMR